MRNRRRRLTRGLLGLATALALAGCSSSPALSDPEAILDAAIDSVRELSSVHLEAELVGSIPLDLGVGEGDNPIDLSGASLAADLDLEDGSTRATIGLPMLLGLEAEVIVVDDASYTRISFLGDRYQKSPVEDAEGPAGLLSDPQQALDDLERAIDELEAPPERLPDERCGSEDCYRVRVSFAEGEGGAPASAEPGLPTRGTLDVWVRKSDRLPAKLELRGPDDPDALSVSVELSEFNKPLDISAPPPDQVDEGG